MYHIGHEIPSPTRGKRGCVTQYERRVIFEKRRGITFQIFSKETRYVDQTKAGVLFSY